VSFRKEGHDARQVVARLKAAGIAAAPRAGWVRTAPHFYIAPAEIDRMLEVLP
jgi:selenocysteine lyase/cysteine desulfurase